ncbi:Phosphopantetheine attachment site, partial [Clostridium cavendishii DSM 21758]
KNLPEYMIPSYFMKLENMPLNSNGKLDRKSLPSVEENIITGSVYEEPRNEIEEALVKIWEKVLGVNNIGINDNFFELGGHSLKATILMGKIHKAFNIQVELRKLLELKTIKEISEYINSKEKSIYESIGKVEKKEYYLASSAQKRVYILQEFDKKSTAYNIPGAMEIEGKVDIERLEKTFLKLIQRHETLRTSFENLNGYIIQRIHEIESINFRIEEIKVKNEEKINDFIECFDLSKAPLLRVALIKLEEDRHILVFDMHHIISDGTSMAILKREFVEIYKGKELEDLKIQYKDYSEWQNKMQQSKSFKKQEEYWLKEFKGEIPILNIPTDYSRPLVQSFEGDSIEFIIGEEETKRLREIAKETGTTMYMVLLSVFNILLSKYSEQEDIVVGTPIAGRPHADLERIIGMFVNTLVIRSIVNVEISFREYLKSIKEKALSAYENQDYQFDELVDKVKPVRDLIRNPLFDVMFVLQNLEKVNSEIEDLIFKQYNLSHGVEKFDITMTAIEVNNQIYFNLGYKIKLFKHKTMERMSEYFKFIIKTIINNLDIKICQIDLITDEENDYILQNSNYDNLYKEDDYEFEF